MKKRSQLGLVIEGKATSSAVLRLSKLNKELGPVKSSTRGNAKRLSNLLRAGYPIEHYEDLQAANLVLIRSPDSAVPQLVEQLTASELPMQDMCFVLCESWLGQEVLEPLAARGASVATLINLPTTRKDWFAVEGQVRAVRQTRRFLKRNGARSDELKAGSLHRLFASQLIATALPIPALQTMQQALRASGFSGNILALLIEQMTMRMLQEFLRGARGPWGGPLNECSSEVSDRYLQMLKDSSPDLATYLDEQMALARRTMELERLV